MPAARNYFAPFLLVLEFVSQFYRKDKAPFKEDLPKLFELLASGNVSPAIAHRLPLLAARKSQELLQAGGVTGKIVLLRELGLSASG